MGLYIVEVSVLLIRRKEIKEEDEWRANCTDDATSDDGGESEPTDYAATAADARASGRAIPSDATVSDAITARNIVVNLTT